MKGRCWSCGDDLVDGECPFCARCDALGIVSGRHPYVRKERRDELARYGRLEVR